MKRETVNTISEAKFGKSTIDKQNRISVCRRAKRLSDGSGILNNLLQKKEGRTKTVILVFCEERLGKVRARGSVKE